MFIVLSDNARAECGMFTDIGGSASQSSREQVKAELREATRLGLVCVGEGNIPIATAEQERMIAKAGQDAAKQFAKSDDAEG